MNKLIIKSLTFVSFLGFAVVANADTLLNTFGTVTSPGFLNNVQYVVDSGQYMGRSFVTSFGSYNLTEIDIALEFNTSNSIINVNLCSDNAGAPGSVLESFGVTNSGTLSFGSRYVLTSLTHPFLAMGGTYYVTMTPGDANSGGGWSFTNDAHTATLNYSVNSGTTWNTTTNTDGAVTVQGALVPEPASMVVLGLGGLALVRRRKAIKLT